MHRSSEFRTAADVRQACRTGLWQTQTSGLVPGATQANLVILPRTDAEEFAEFCRRNPKPCPVLEITSPGSFEAVQIAPRSDLRTDLPGYRIWRVGKLDAEPSDLHGFWRDDLVSFLIGCSFTFEAALIKAGLRIRHLEEGRNVPMYITNRPCTAAGRFHGPLVVSMRPFPAEEARRAAKITAEYPAVHGAPVHSGDPAALGIADLSRPDFGDAVTVHPDETPVFWACGVTPQAIVVNSRPDFVITHQPGGMFLTDLMDDQLLGQSC